jgi:hypothetical protein
MTTRRLNYLKEKTNISTDILEEIFKYDPSENKKYSQWLCNLYTQGEIKPEEFPNARNYLTLFDLAKKKNYIEAKDINKFSSLKDLYKSIEDYLELLSQPQSKKEIKKSCLIYCSKKWEIYSPNTHDEMCLLGKNTKWCVARSDNFGNFWDYKNCGSFFMFKKIIKHKKKKFPLKSKKQNIDETKFLLHLERCEFSNADNRQTPITTILKFKELHPFFITITENLFQKKLTELKEGINFNLGDLTLFSEINRALKTDFDIELIKELFSKKYKQGSFGVYNTRIDLLKSFFEKSNTEINNNWFRINYSKWTNFSFLDFYMERSIAFKDYLLNQVKNHIVKLKRVVNENKSDSIFYIDSLFLKLADKFDLLNELKIILKKFCKINHFKGSIVIESYCGSEKFNHFSLKLNNLKKVDGSLYLLGTNILGFSNLEIVGKSLVLEENNKIKYLDKLEFVGNELNLADSKITSLKKLKVVLGSFNSSQNLKSINNLIYLGESLYLNSKRPLNFDKLIFIGWALDVSYQGAAALKSLKSLTYVGNTLDLTNSKVKQLNNLIFVGNNFNLKKSRVSSINNLKVVLGFLDYRQCNIHNTEKLSSILFEKSQELNQIIKGILDKVSHEVSSFPLAQKHLAKLLKGWEFQNE